MMGSLYWEIRDCRACHSQRLEQVLDLGSLCVSDFVLPEDTEECRAPLTLVQCLDCSLVQLRHTVHRDKMFRHYYYRSATNETMVAALKDVVEDAIRQVKLETDDSVLDIGCNDGTLLSFYPRWVWAHGFEPARNLVAEACKRSRANKIFTEYFPPRAWRPFDQYKIITSIASFYNVDRPDLYVEAVKQMLHPQGIWVIQMQGLAPMLGCNGFDNICHEHTLYPGREALERLFNSYGLQIVDESFSEVNGGSIRYIVKHGLPRRLPPSKGSVDKEWREFAYRVEHLKTDTVRLLDAYRRAGKRVLGVAASTKGNTTLQYYDVTTDLIEAIGDRNPEKEGRLTVGSAIPIISEEEMFERKPDALFVLAWSFFNAFRERYKHYQGQWILPLPNLRILQGGEECPLSLTDALYANA